ncbi:hypothetical protein SADUNF_Sadunf05G0080200 [Salix dunnii]|uniref:RING-type domain-containing protein n=1 Tax=Salix dunnii TaxID=1413687 RepID=A0A835K487_9ROSI|nr:hypothetical protein SADUNF_Sadunf05G0080200 [Salix dunnii]
MGLRGHPRIKDAATACKRIALDESGRAKQGVLESPVGSSSSEIIEAEGEYCCVCLSRLKADEDTCALPCSHQFHKLSANGAAGELPSTRWGEILNKAGDIQ